MFKKLFGWKKKEDDDQKLDKDLETSEDLVEEESSQNESSESNLEDTKEDIGKKVSETKEENFEDINFDSAEDQIEKDQSKDKVDSDISIEYEEFAGTNKREDGIKDGFPEKTENLKEEAKSHKEKDSIIDETLNDESKEDFEDNSYINKADTNKDKDDLETETIEEDDESLKAESNEETEEEKKEKKGFFSNFFKGLAKTRDNISSKIDSILKAGKIDEEMYESLEDVLIMADVGAQTTVEIVERLRDRVKEKKITETEDVKAELNSIVKDLMNENNLDNTIDLSNTPKLILVVGVNGVGKTTSIGKMAKKFKDQGESVMFAAADTFRAAAVEQLGEWAQRNDVEMISGSENADPGSVVYDAIAAAKSRNTDILIVDTAGRLHNKKNLMNELNKIYRIIEKEYSHASLDTLMVLDATTGQNAMNQAKEFSEVADINGVILTKMDGTAKGGVVIRIQSELNIPVKYIGLGEGIEDLRDFSPDAFVDSIIS